MNDPLLEALAAADERAVTDLVRGWPEARRKERAGQLVAILRELERHSYFLLEPDGTVRVFRHGHRGYHHSFGQRRATRLAVLATASLTQLRRFGARGFAFYEPAIACEVLLDRRPAWLQSFATWLLAVDTGAPAWPQLRPLVRAGAIEPPPLYVERLLVASRDTRWRAPRLYGDDPSLFEHEVWELLASGGGAVDSLTAAEAAGAGWREAILGAIDDGVMARERVLDALLTALASDISAYGSTWYTKTWRSLAVTPAERAARIDGLRALLGAPAAPVLGFAVEALGRVRDLPAGIEHELGGALTAPAKKTVRGALKLLDRCPGEARAAVATAALVHEAADVQGDVLDRLERWGLTDAARDALLRHLDLLAATQRPRAEALLGFAWPAGDEVPAAGDAPDADAIPAPIRAALGFGAPVPVAPVPGEPVLGEALAPIASLDELADALHAGMLEWWSCRDERLLDGILRFCDRREPFAGRLLPLVPPLTRIAAGKWYAAAPMAAAAWLTGEVPELDHSPTTWSRRVHAAAEQAARGEPAPLLAFPSHAGGWIAPAALVERLWGPGDGRADAQAEPRRPVAGHPRDAGEDELAQALLRLAPDGRDAALRAADGLGGRAGAIVRCALGGDAVEDDGLAAAAARAVREPPLSPQPRFGIRTHAGRRPVDRLAVLRLAPRPAPAGPIAEHLGAATPRTGRERYFVRADPLGWPAQRQVACAAAIARIGWNLGTETPGESGAAAVLMLLVREGEPLPPLALRLIGLALGSSVARESVLAVDVVIAAIEDGRIDAHALLPGLRADVGQGLLLTNRVAGRLAAVAAAGPLHRAVVRELLDGTVGVLAALPARTYAPLLVLFDELCAPGTRVDAARPFLATLTGSSQAAKAARALLAREHDPPESERRLALAARTRRARRWADLSG